MSKHETPMILAYWHRAGGLLLEEFELVARGSEFGPRRADAVIIQGCPLRRARRGERAVSIAGRNVIVIQAKASRLGMYLLGQALFSRDLVLALGARHARTVALCSRDDAILRPLAERHSIEIEVMSDDRRRT